MEVLECLSDGVSDEIVWDYVVDGIVFLSGVL